MAPDETPASSSKCDIRSERFFIGFCPNWLSVFWPRARAGPDTEVLNDLSYFGPSEIIFRFLDKDDEGTVSIEEFRELDNFRRRPRRGSKASA